jgi:hypothetical protein
MSVRYIRVFLTDGTIYDSARMSSEDVTDDEWKEAAEQTYQMMDEADPGKFRMDLAGGGTLVTTLKNVHHIEYREETETSPLPDDESAGAAL